VRRTRRGALVAVVVGALAAVAAPATRAATPAPTSTPDCLTRVGGVDLQQATITDLEAAMAAGRLTSVELVDQYERRIAAYDAAGPKLNSIRALNPHAREQAAALDAERAAGHVRGPLHGIPILLKDNVGTRGEPTTAGSIALANNIPKHDATLTTKLVAAGAVILGKTNLSEFANWVSYGMPNGYSSLGGQVHNAYTGGDPSGSSSGSGVAGSMALAAAAIGTETSGSILGPSDANSLVGVKPTVGLVSRFGVIPLAGHFDTPGPMARTVADAAAVLGAVAGPDARDPITATARLAVPTANDYTAGLRTDALHGVRLGYDPNLVTALFQRALVDLRAAGATVVPIRTVPGISDTGEIELGVIPNEFKFGINDYLAHEAGPGLPVHDLTGIILYNQQHPDRVKYGQDLLIASDATPGSGPLADLSAFPIINDARDTVDLTLARDHLDALIGPSLTWVAIGAAAGYPTVIVPEGYNGRSPEGISFFGRGWSEARLLAYAYAYEQQSHRRLPPTMVNPTLTRGVCP